MVIAIVKCADCGAEYEIHNAEEWLTYFQLNGEERIACKNCYGDAFVKEVCDE